MFWKGGAYLEGAYNCQGGLQWRVLEERVVLQCRVPFNVGVILQWRVPLNVRVVLNRRVPFIVRVLLDREVP